MAIITISRGTFSGGKELAECLAEKLGYDCISREVIVQATSEYGVPLDKLSHALDDAPGVLERMTLERIHYLAYIKAALARHIKDERIVYHGHAGHLLLKGIPHILRVRIIADMEFRIKAAMERQSLDRKQAVAFIKKTDEERRRWTSFLYHEDIYNPLLYDIILNLEHITIQGACQIIYTSARLLEFQPTPESQKRLSDFAVAADIRARIAQDSSIGDEDIEIEADGGVITITGSVNSLQDADILREFVRKLPRVSDVVSHLRAPVLTGIGRPYDS